MTTTLSIVLGLLLLAIFLLIRQRRQLTLLRHQKQQYQRREKRLRTVLDNVPDLIYVKDRSGRYLECNRAFATFVGQSVAQVCRSEGPLVRDGAELEALDSQVLSTRYIQHCEQWASHYGGQPALLSSQKLLIHGSGNGNDTVLSISRDITRQKHDEALLRLQSNILDQVLRGEAQDIVLHSIVQQIEQIVPDMRCSILLLDRERRHLLCGAAPSLPDFYNQAIEGLAIGEGVGSCGHAAATGELTIVSDIKAHPYWSAFCELADKAGLAACWSQPIFGSVGEVVGTFALYYPHTLEPDSTHIELIRTAAQLTGLALERQQSEAMLAEALPGGGAEPEYGTDYRC